jgi:hypothetical protein
MPLPRLSLLHKWIEIKQSPGAAPRNDPSQGEKGTRLKVKVRLPPLAYHKSTSVELRYRLAPDGDDGPPSSPAQFTPTERAPSPPLNKMLGRPEDHSGSFQFLPC